MKYELVVTILLIAAGSLLRVIFTPYSTGSDILQFYGFAKSFSSNPMCLYIHETDSGEEWPYSWLYIYGPVLALALLAAYRVVGSGDMVDWWWEGGRYVVVVDNTWILSLKVIFIVGDIVSAYLLYRIARGFSPVKGALLAGLYYASPIVLYTSSIYGMFDSIALMFMLSSLALSSRPLISGLLAGTAIITKQTMILPAIFTGIAIALYNYRRAYWYFTGLLLAVSLPFAILLVLCPESSPGLVIALKQQSLVYYPKPLVYSMNGLSSVATYMNDKLGYNTLALIKSWPIALGTLAIVILVGIMKSKGLRDPIAVSSLAYTAFIVSYWRVNPQYLAPLIAFILLLLLKCGSHWDRGLRISLVVSFVVANLWPVMYPIDFWFHVHIREPNEAVRVIVKFLSLNIYNINIYVIYSLALTASLIATIIQVVRRCR